MCPQYHLLKFTLFHILLLFFLFFSDKSLFHSQSTMLFSICSPHALVPVGDLTNYMVVLRNKAIEWLHNFGSSHCTVCQKVVIEFHFVNIKCKRSTEEDVVVIFYRHTSFDVKQKILMLFQNVQCLMSLELWAKENKAPTLFSRVFNRSFSFRSKGVITYSWSSNYLILCHTLSRTLQKPMKMKTNEVSISRYTFKN